MFIAWADLIKVVRITERPRAVSNGTAPGQSPFMAEISAVFQLDCMISSLITQTQSTHSPPSQLVDPSALLVLTYNPPANFLSDEMALDRSQQARKEAERPELRLLSRSGEELTTDCISVSAYASWSCNDYNIVSLPSAGQWIVLSPKDLVLVQTRDDKDHLSWLLERGLYAEALQRLDDMEQGGRSKEFGPGFDVPSIGQRYIEHLVSEGMLDFLADSIVLSVCYR